jgi:hypothetical protein
VASGHAAFRLAGISTHLPGVETRVDGPRRHPFPVAAAYRRSLSLSTPVDVLEPVGQLTQQRRAGTPDHPSAASGDSNLLGKLIACTRKVPP